MAVRAVSTHERRDPCGSGRRDQQAPVGAAARHAAGSQQRVGRRASRRISRNSHGATPFRASSPDAPRTSSATSSCAMVPSFRCAAATAVSIARMARRPRRASWPRSARRSSRHEPRRRSPCGTSGSTARPPKVGEARAPTSAAPRGVICCCSPSTLGRGRERATTGWPPDGIPMGLQAAHPRRRGGRGRVAIERGAVAHGPRNTAGRAGSCSMRPRGRGATSCASRAARARRCPGLRI